MLALGSMGDGLKDIRERALLLPGFAAALRRAELVGLDVNYIERLRHGLVIHLRRSKTDQNGKGETVGIPLGRTRWCPVNALETWIAESGITEEPIFRPVDRYGLVRDERLMG